jgi:hypothetical protein
MNNSQSDLLTLLFLIFCGLMVLVVYLLPSIIAFCRNHHYKWVILAINCVLGLTGIGYLIVFVWSVWPRQTAVFDVVTNDPTTNSSEAGQKIYGQMGTNVRAFKNAKDSDDEFLRRLAKLRNDGVITEEDFGRKKKEILGL